MFYIGVDVDSRGVQIAVINNQGNVLFNGKIDGMDLHNYIKFKLVKEFPPGKSIVTMESTSSSYHLFPKRIFEAFGYPTFVVNPYVIKKYAEFKTIRSKKTDRYDAKVIAEFTMKELVHNKEALEKLKGNIVPYRYITRLYLTQRKYVQKLKGNLFSKILEVYPYLDKVFKGNPLDTKIGELFIKYGYNLAYSNSRVSPETVKDFLCSHGLIHLGRGSSYSHRICEYIHWLRATGYKPDDLSICSLHIAIQNYAFAKDMLDKLEEEILELTKDIEEVKLLLSIPHIGHLSAAIIYAEIGDIRRFSSWNKLYAYFGLEPMKKQSGTIETKGKLSRRGFGPIRGLFYTIALSSIKENGLFKEYYERRVSEGKPPKIVLTSIIQKFVRRIHNVLKYRKAYNHLYDGEVGRARL